MPLTTRLGIGWVAGIERGVNWSSLIAAGLIVWVLAAGVFPEANPGLGEVEALARDQGRVDDRDDVVP
jgi:hypothetical protein